MAAASMPSASSRAPSGDDLVFVERDVDLAVGEHALLRLEAQGTLDQRLMLAEEQIVGVRPVDAADLVDVAEAFGNDERGPGAGPLQNGVDGDGRAVEEQPGGGIIGARLLDSGGDPLDEMMRRRQRLAEAELAGPLIERRNVRERAADIGGQPQAG